MRDMNFVGVKQYLARYYFNALNESNNLENVFKLRHFQYV